MLRLYHTFLEIWICIMWYYKCQKNSYIFYKNEQNPHLKWGSWQPGREDFLCRFGLCKWDSSNSAFRVLHFDNNRFALRNQQFTDKIPDAFEQIIREKCTILLILVSNYYQRRWAKFKKSVTNCKEFRSTFITFIWKSINF